MKARKELELALKKIKKAKPSTKQRLINYLKKHPELIKKTLYKVMAAGLGLTMLGAAGIAYKKINNKPIKKIEQPAQDITEEELKTIIKVEDDVYPEAFIHPKFPKKEEKIKQEIKKIQEKKIEQPKEIKKKKIKQKNIKKRYSRKDLKNLTVMIAKEIGIDPHLALALVHGESNFNPRAKSYAGAIGLTQCMPSLVGEMQRLKKLGKVSFAPKSIRELYDPEINLKTGLSYLKYLMQHKGLDEHKALRAYNAGIRNMNIRQAKKYADRIRSLKKKYRN